MTLVASCSIDVIRSHHRRGLALGLALGLGCRAYAEGHCGNLDGDLTCAERGGGQYCDACQAQGDGCTDAPPAAGCHFAGPGSAGSPGGTTMDEPTAVDAEATGPEPMTTGASACTSDDECDDPEAPFCAIDRGECVACDRLAQPDAACAGRDESMPVCVDGECVQCSEASTAVCDAQLQVCDPAARVCVGCEEHEACASGACEVAEGRCFPPDARVLEVDRDGGAEFVAVAAAVAAVADGAQGIIVIHEPIDAAPYQAPHLIDGGKLIALLGAPGETPVLMGPNVGGSPALRVEGADTTVYVAGIALRDTPLPGRGLVVRQGTAWVDRSRIVQNAGGGVLAQDGARVTIRSSFVGGSEDDVAAVEVDGATARISYSTLSGGLGMASALTCDAAATVEARNSVLVAQSLAPEVSCDGSFERCAAELALGPGNTAVGFMRTMWFSGYAVGDLGLSPTGATTFAEVARWEAGDPRTDIDGDARPTVDGAPDFAGADVP